MIFSDESNHRAVTFVEKAEVGEYKINHREVNIEVENDLAECHA